MARSRRTMRSPAPRNLPARQTQHTQPAVQAPPSMAPARQGPGLLGQMATTAAGVAVGSAVGHTLGAAMTGAFSGGNQNVELSAPSGAYDSSNNMNPCQMQLSQFLKCTESYDLTLCDGFNKALLDCKRTNGLQATL